MSSQTSMIDLIDTTTILSLLSTLAILGAAYALSTCCLSTHSSIKPRVFFIWHAFDALTHFILEGSYLYNCFYIFTTLDHGAPGSSTASSAAAAAAAAASSASAFLPPNVHFLDDASRLYGPRYGTNAFSALWREYAKADHRWAGTDLTVISLELLTVFLMGPVAVWVCVCLATSSREDGKGKRGGEWFWMVVLATGELYGGFMTFAPEWLSGSPNLDTSNFMYKWVYLFFFNTLWVWIPLWILYEAYFAINGALSTQHASQQATKKLV